MSSIGPKIQIEGEAQFKKAINDINTSLKTMGTEMRAVTSAYDRNDKSSGKLTAQNQVLNKQIDLQREKLKNIKFEYEDQNIALLDLGAELQSVTAKYGENSKEVMVAQRAYDAQAKSIDKLERDINNSTTALNKSELQLRNNNRTLGEYASEAEKAASRTEIFKKKTEELSGKLQKAGDGIKGVGDTLTKYITVPATAAAGAVTGIVTALGWGRLKAMDSARAQLQGLGYDLEEVERISKQVSSAVQGTTITMAEGTSIAAGALAAGIDEGEELERYIKLVGDAAVGSGRDMAGMASIFNRVQGSGKLMTQELNMIEDGMPGFSQAMADGLGVTQAEFRKMVTAGKISSEQFLGVMEDFAGEMSGAYANSWEGMVSNTKANIGIIGESLMGGVFQQSKESVGEFLDLLRSDSIRSWAKETGKLLGETFKNILSTIKDTIKWFTDLDSSTQKLIGKVAIFVVALGPLLSIFGSILSVASSFTLALPTLGLVLTALTGPVGITVASLGLLAGILGTATLASRDTGNEIINLTKIVKEDTKAWEKLQEQQERNLETSLVEIDRTQALWQELQTLVDTNGNVIGSKERVKYISDEINALAPESIQWIDEEKIAYQESAKAIDDLIQKKRAQIILEAQEPFYKEALLKLGDKQMEQAEAAIALSAQEIRAQEAKDKALEQGGLINVVAYENQKGILEDMQADYAKNEGILGDYYSTIQDFEENSAAVASSNYEKIKEINVGAVASYKTATDGTVEQLQRQAIEAEINAQLMRDRYNEGTKGVTEDMVKNAEETARKANEEYLKVGGEIVDGVEKGVKNKEGGFIATIRNMAQSAISAARKALDSHSPSRKFIEIGEDVGEGLAIGVKESTGIVREAAKKIGNILIGEEEKIQKQLAEMDKTAILKKEKESEQKHKEALDKKYAELAKANKKNQQKIYEDIAKLQADREKEISDNSEKALRDSLNSQLKTIQDFKKDYEKALDDIQKSQENMSRKLVEFGGLFERTQNKLGRDVFNLTDLQKDIDMINSYGEALENLKDRGISDSLLKEIESMGVDDALDYTKKLLSKTDENYEEYMALWEEKQTAAKAVAIKFYQDEMDSLQDEFVNKLPDELSHVKDEMRDIGIQSGQGLALGFRSQAEYIKNTFVSVLESAMASARASMDINSPSERWADLVGAPMAQGLGKGFTEQMREVTRQINASIPTTVSPTVKMGEGIVNGLAGIIPQQSNQPIIIQLVADGKTLAQTVYDPLNNIARQKGVPAIG